MARLPDGIVRGEDGRTRCWWAAQAPDYAAYHDLEWGRPVTEDRRLFEKLCLEGFQSGLSWLTILRKRDRFRHAFRDFDIERVARFGKRDVDRLLRDAGIVRHRGKIESTINNARCALELVEEFDSLAAYFWRYEPSQGSRPRRLDRKALMALSRSAESVALSRACSIVEVIGFSTSTCAPDSRKSTDTR